MHYLLKNKFPVETLEQLEKAASYMNDHIKFFEPTHRVVIACKMEKRASELNAEVPMDWAKNYVRFVNPEARYSPDFHINMQMRKEACAGRICEVDGKTYKAEDVVSMIEKSAEMLPVHDVAGLISDFDKKAGLEQDYDHRLMDPIFTVVGSHINPDYDMQKIAGSCVTEHDVIKAANSKEYMDKLASVLDDSACKSFSQNPVKFCTENPLLRQVVLDSIK